jgi:hypothetical protein
MADTWLALLRWGLGLQVILYCLSSHADWNYLLAGNAKGLISRELAEAVLSVDGALIPRVGWLVAVGEHLGISEGTILTAIWAALLTAGICLVFGMFCRLSAIVAWLLHLCAVKSGAFWAYGMDSFTTIGLFYLMVSPLPDRYSFDLKIRKLSAKSAQLQGFHCRVLQLHLCLIYLFGGLCKALGPGWWDGTSIWRALTRPPFNMISLELLAKFGAVLSIVGISVCLLEMGYPVFIWSRRTRLVWLVGVIGMHMAIGLAMGLYLFGLIMIILNVAAFGPSGLGLGDAGDNVGRVPDGTPGANGHRHLA